MSANVQYPALTNETTLWNTRAEAEAFFNNFIVNDATPTTAGVTKQATTLSYSNFTAYSVNNFSVLNIDGSEIALANQDTFEEVRTKLLALTTSYNNLLIRLRNAGILAS